MIIAVSTTGVAIICAAIAVLVAALLWSPLGVLNFVLLQWFGIRLARRMDYRMFVRPGRTIRKGELVNAADVERRLVQIGWGVLRYVWPLTGWWSPFRWIARRGDIR